ncbi:hypothetical protein PXH66_10810 [Synoicihabitans lomoniglobus]|uniref:O-antigen polysaccharide polymerase Wzy n=1 Tax=Synoicihabitans lomoniglobus TaxID=2909285 RepID=A0AAF0CSQ1_9BACT|nr:hypothetical protein PXH66_10810 [Opitutaceae bacterium LMO-M01]
MASYRLYRFGAGLLTAAIFAIWLAHPERDVTQIALGSAMLVLAVLPALMWAKHMRLWFPVFEIFMLTGVAFYVLPFTGSQSDLVGFDPAVLNKSAFTVVAFQIAAIFAFNTTRMRFRPSRSWTRPLLPESAMKLSAIGIWLNTAYIGISQFTVLIPYELAAPLRAVFFGCGTISVFIQCRYWGQQRLSGYARLGLIANIFAQSAMLASQLYLINVISILGLSFIAYTTTSRKIPLLAIAISIPFLGLLHSGKSEMRKIYWGGDSKRAPELTDLYSFYQEWFALGISGHGENSSENDTDASLIQRASLFQIIAVTVDRVPDKLPFLSGESYKDVPALFVPRYFWPGKPTALEANVRLSLYFGLVAEYSADSVSIAFGMLAEAYANFGFIGILGLGALMGTLFKRVCVAAEGVDLLSPLGIFVILLTAWSLQVEMVAATWLSSLFQATVVMVLGPMFGLRLIGR